MQKFLSFLNGLSGRIIIGMVLGVILGLSLGESATHFEILGKMFLNLMNMCIPFLIFGSIVMSVSSLDLKEFKTVGSRTLLLFLITTACASFFAVFMGYFLPFTEDPVQAAKAVEAGAQTTQMGITGIILNFFPSNVFQSFGQPIVLQVIVFGCFFGIGINLLKETVPGVDTLLEVTLAFRAVIMKIITLIMYIAPIGIFGILASTIGTKGLDTLIALGQVLVYITVINILFLVLYTLFISVRYGLNLGMLIKKCARVLIMAITTTSTAMCLPVAMEDVKNLGVKEKLSNFILPLGNSLNTNGGPITNVIIIIAAMTLQGSIGEMTLTWYILLGVYATIAAFGNPGVIGGALVSLAVVCDLVGVPIEVAVIFFGVDYFLGITRVPINIMGSVYCCIMLSKSFGEFDHEVFNQSLEELKPQKQEA